MHNISFISLLDVVFCICFGFGMGMGIKLMFDYQKEDKNSDKVVDMIGAIAEFSCAMICLTCIIRGVA